MLSILLRSGSVRVEPFRIELEAVVDEVLYEQRELLSARGVGVRVERPLPAFWCNEDRLKQIVVNLVCNAVKHGCGNNPEKTVQISVGCDQARGMIIVVRDPGSGFDPESLPSPVVGDQLYAEGGRGIFLINQLMDEVRFRQKGTEIWMRKK